MRIGGSTRMKNLDWIWLRAIVSMQIWISFDILVWTYVYLWRLESLVSITQASLNRIRWKETKTNWWRRRPWYSKNTELGSLVPLTSRLKQIAGKYEEISHAGEVWIFNIYGKLEIFRKKKLWRMKKRDRP